MPLTTEEKKKQEEAPAKMAIGGDSGFQVDSASYNVHKQSELILLEAYIKIPLPCPDLPELVLRAIDEIQVLCMSSACFNKTEAASAHSHLTVSEFDIAF